MATTPGTAVPGTVIPTGSAFSPGGSQGVQGLQGAQGPTVVSTDAGNTATLGSDSKIFVGYHGPLAIRKFTASGTYTPTAGMVMCIIECVGGGGGGGGVVGTANYSLAGGGGGSG